VIVDFIESMRPRQWIKNCFVFTALIFSRNVFDPVMVFRVTLAFFFFCAVSGVVYIINDTCDLEKDRLHPTKKERPIASGRLDSRSALSVAIPLLILTLAAASFVSRSLIMTLAAYFLLNLAYSIKLKDIVLLDAFAISAGFVLRVFAGALVINVSVSSWLIICTILLALFLAFSKRRHEIVVLEVFAIDHRRILGEYSTTFLDQMISVVTASTVISYALYTMSDETIAKFDTRSLIYTVPFVLYGVFRYLYLVHQKKGGGDPAAHLLTDIPLIINIIIWIVTASFIIYYP